MRLNNVVSGCLQRVLLVIRKRTGWGPQAGRHFLAWPFLVTLLTLTLVTFHKPEAYTTVNRGGGGLSIDIGQHTEVSVDSSRLLELMDYLLNAANSCFS